jgi:hypothetical protein
MAQVAVLSARTVQSLREPGMYLDGRGLYLRIGPAGNKSWIYRFAQSASAVPLANISTWRLLKREQT